MSDTILEKNYSGASDSMPSCFITIGMSLWTNVQSNLKAINYSLGKQHT